MLEAFGAEQYYSAGATGSLYLFGVLGATAGWSSSVFFLPIRHPDKSGLDESRSAEMALQAQVTEGEQSVVGVFAIKLVVSPVAMERAATAP